MSTSLIYNGNFSQPSITTNSYIYTTAFTQAQTNQLYWNSSANVALQNGITIFNFSDPSLINQTQFISIQNTGTISQSFTVTQLGTYTLYFFYCSRQGYSLNNVQIYLNGSLFDSVSTQPPARNWATYNNPNLSPILGVNTILFQGLFFGQELDLGLSNIQIFYGQTGQSPPLTTVQNNSFKSTNFYGAINVYDYIPSGGSLIQGLITTQRNYNYNYAIFPTYTANTLGYQYIYNYSLSGVLSSNTTITSTPIILPLGYYLVNSYCLYTLTSSSYFYTSLGLNTISNTLNLNYNYTKQYCPPISNLQQSIFYQYYLQDISGSSYYFIFNSGANTNGGQINKFNGSFLRIA